jgi:hypothetical protein
MNKYPHLSNTFWDNVYRHYTASNHADYVEFGSWLEGEYGANMRDLYGAVTKDVLYHNYLTFETDEDEVMFILKWG